MTEVPVFLEPADVSRRLTVMPSTVRHYAKTGALPIAALTERGGRLFRAEDVEAFRRRREARAV